MPNRRKDGSMGHAPQSETAREAMAREIAVKEWLRVPAHIIARDLDISAHTITQYRAHPAYGKALEFLRKDWESKLADAPQTLQLRRDLAHGVGIAVRRCIGIVASEKSRDGNALAAAKLLAQMDGRFLTAETYRAPEDKPQDQIESLASELLKAVRSPEKVQ